MTRQELLERLEHVYTLLLSGRAGAKPSVNFLIRDIREEGVLDIQQPPAVNDQRWFYTSWDDFDQQFMSPYDTEQDANTAAVDADRSHFFVFPLIGKCHALLTT